MVRPGLVFTAPLGFMLKETRTILDRLLAADRAHQQEAGGGLLLRSVKYGCGVVVMLFVADVILHLQAGWRLAWLLTLVVGVLLTLGASWYVAFIRRNRLEQIARFLEARHPDLGSRLINLLQLQAQIDDTTLAPETRELARQAVANYQIGLEKIPLETMAWTGELRRQLGRASLALAIFLAVLAGFFRISAVELARFTDPFGDHPPYSFTHLEIVDPGVTGTNVLYGKSLVVRVKTSGHPPKEVFLTAFPPDHPERAVTLSMFDKGRQGFDQLIDKIHQELVIYAHTKDRVSLSKQARIGVILTPQLEKVWVRVAPPAYTGLTTEEKPYAFQGVQALQGSQVHFRLQSNRPLREGVVEVSLADQPVQRVPLRAGSASNEVAGFFEARETGRLRFGLTDVAGIQRQGEGESALTVTFDLPPEVRIAEPDHDSFVAMDFKVQVRLEASDDYGVRLTRLHRGLNGVHSQPKTSAYETVVRNSAETTELEIARLGVQPGDVISLFGEALDTAPEPHAARSQTVRLMVISVEDYNNFLREQTDLADAQTKYQSLQDDLQELIEEQKKLGTTAEKLKDRLEKGEPKDREAALREFDQLMASQNELNQKLNRQAERMENFVRQDPLYDVEKELEKTLKEEAANIRQSAGTNNAAASQLAQKSSPPQGQRQIAPEMLNDFKQESDAQIARLDRTQQTASKEMMEPLQDMSAMQELVKDFNQFEALYRAQQDLASQAQAYNRSGELGREDQLALKELASTQKQVGDLLDELKEKLREDAQTAERLFPKAAASGRQLADKITELRMPPLAREATGQMLDGHGDRSFQTADRLRDEMEKLFSQCQSGNCPSGSELDQYLQLQRGMKPGKNFAQMSRSRKFARPGSEGNPQGQGEGAGGRSGYAITDGSKLPVLGNEMMPSRDSATAKQSARQGKGASTLAGARGPAEAGKPDVIQGLKPIDRRSGSVAAEGVIEGYNDVVESYFRAITTRKKQ